MAEDVPAPEPMIQRIRFWLRIHRFSLSLIILGVGLLMVVLSMGDFTPLNAVWPFTTINSYTDRSATGAENWNLLFVVVGPILVIIGGYLVGSYVVARRRFEQLMRSKSKAELLRNIPEIEDLLWDLLPYDQVRFEQKCSELRIRR